MKNGLVILFLAMLFGNPCTVKKDSQGAGTLETAGEERYLKQRTAAPLKHFLDRG